jgi:hypothetical protein
MSFLGSPVRYSRFDSSIAKIISLVRIVIFFRLIKMYAGCVHAYALTKATPATEFTSETDPGIDSKKPNPLAYVAWQVDTTTLFLLGSYPP